MDSNKSLYEKDAEKNQEELLKTTCTLEQCIQLLRENSNILSTAYMEAQVLFTAKLFGLIPEEIEDAIKGKTYWCL